MTIQEFLNDNSVLGITKEVAVSDRFIDDSGELLTFTIMPLSLSHYEEARRKATIYDKNGKGIVDNNAFVYDIVIKCTVNPNFKDSKSIEGLGVISPNDYINKTMLSGEVYTLCKEIMRFSGFDKSASDLIKTAKN